MLPRHFFRLSALIFLVIGLASHGATKPFLRPPSVPLAACDPYFSIWSPADTLAQANTVHWTGKAHRLTALARIDGKTWRLMGKEPADLPVLSQVDTQVMPTRTICTFRGSGVRLDLIFMTPALPDDLMIYCRPVTYVVWELRSEDAQDHAVQIYLDVAAEIAVNTPDQRVRFSDQSLRNLQAARVGTVAQPVLMKQGDDLRIDWGYLYLAAVKSQGPFVSVATAAGLREQFITDGYFPQSNAIESTPVPAVSAPVMAVSMNAGRVGVDTTRRWMLLAYDDEYSIQYFKANLRPYWRKDGDDAAALLEKSAVEFDVLKQRCEEFDARVLADLKKAGGEAYAAICSLAYRQCVAGNKVVADGSGQPLMFPKENFSNGCIGTVDVLYPMAPQFLYFSPALTRAMLKPLMDYAASPRWKFPFAPHDLGTYPLANGQVYGGGENSEKDQMPVEETANLLILLAALAQAEGNAVFAAPYQPLLDKWAGYLRESGFDPENQLCTDDFAGHLAHNVNLSAKAICGLGAYAKLCRSNGREKTADEFDKIARELAGRWLREADDGNHFRLAFNQPGSWSQKYNLVWDQLLGLGLFPETALRKEMASYTARKNAYGLPLDNRKDYTKLDWILWTATMAKDQSEFSALVNPVLKFLNETPDRVPMTDWYDTRTGRKTGFQARPVVGGVFIKALLEKNRQNRP